MEREGLVTTWGNWVVGYACLCCNMSMRALVVQQRGTYYILCGCVPYIQSVECRVQSRDPKIPRNLNFHPIIATAIYRVVLHETDTPYFTVNNIPT